jgi:hypothetical protein
LTTFTSLNLPFHLIESPHFQNLLQLTQSAPSILSFPCGQTIQRWLEKATISQQRAILDTLPPTSKLSLSLDCWTSPFQQAFIAITGYFLDESWEYREVLLGFEPLLGTHSGENLAKVVQTTIEAYDLSDRIIAITADNASNNHTLVTSLQAEYPTCSFIRNPCMAHVIQLSLKQLLGQMKAGPENDTIDLIWSEDLSRSKRGIEGIAKTLQKARNLAIYINASPQRRDTFLGLQDPTKVRLFLLQDVRTRWNSTFLMLQRAKRVRTELDRYCLISELTEMKLSSDEWQQIDYLLYITEPFYQFTTVLCKTKDITIHTVFLIYNKLFVHLEASIRKLQRKKVSFIRSFFHSSDLFSQKS